MAFSHRLVSILVLLYNFLCAPLLFLAPTLLFTHSKYLILTSCSNSTGPTTRSLEAFDGGSSCYNQRKALYLFAIFNIVRILSFKYEKVFYKMNEYCNCAVRQYRPGLYLNSALAVPFLARQVCNAFFDSYGAHFFFVFTVASCSFVLMLPYVRDMCFLVISVVKGVVHNYYSTKLLLVLSVLAATLYVFLVLVNLGYIMCDMSPDWFLMGYPVQFPYLNFPIALFLIHHFILNAHKQLPHVIYEVTEEDVFAYVLRAKCLNWADCHFATQIHLLLVRPSSCTFQQRREIGQRVKLVNSVNEMEPWLADKFRSVLLKSKPSYTVSFNNC
uniref:Nucleoporin NDC1 n=2 Tax=Steinernema glaseri TaxID=37863 RepID=A0A1I8AGS0_9BILA